MPSVPWCQGQKKRPLDLRSKGSGILPGRWSPRASLWCEWSLSRVQNPGKLKDDAAAVGWGKVNVMVEGPAFRLNVPGSRRALVGEWLSGSGKGGAVEGGTLQGAPAAPPLLSSVQNRPQGVVEDQPSVAVAEGGRWFKLRIPGVFRGVRKARGKIREFSMRSQRELLRWVNSIDRSRFDPARVVFVTLTYPQVFPSAVESKRHRKLFLQRFRRAYGRVCVIWKLEPQKRGAPHYHLLLFMPSSYCLQTLNSWIAHNWYEVVGSEDKKHLEWHLGGLGRGNKPCAEPIRDWGGVASYAAKYLGKMCTSKGWGDPGRFWGIESREQLPVKIETRELSTRAAAILKRVCVRWFERQESGWFYLPGKRLSDGRHLPGHKWHGSQIMSGVSSIEGKLSQVWQQVGSLFEVAIRKCRRRWPRGDGGCQMFAPAPMIQRLVAWSVEQAGSSA